MTKSFQKFRKKATQFAVAVTLVGASVVGANAASTTQGIAKQSVNLRKSATTKSKKITTIKAQQSMVIEGTKGNFYKVTYGDQEGYVSKKLVNKYNAEDTQTTIKTIAKLTVRTMPTTNSPSQKLGTLVKGQVVTVKGTIKGAKSTYYVIDYAGQTAYVSANAKYSDIAAADAKNEDVKGTAKVTNVKKVVNIRLGAGTEFDKIGSAPKDTSVDVLGPVQDGWVKVRYQNANGYVSAKCLSDITVGNQAPVIDVNDKQYVVLNSTFTNDTLGAKVSDAEDTNVKVEYTGAVDTTKEGTYKVTITATDSQGAKTEKVVTVVVRKNVAPELFCSYTDESKALKIEEGKTFDYSMLKAEATDQEDGDLTSKIVYTGTVETTSNKTNKDAQKVTMKVTDANGKTVEKTAYVKVVPNTPASLTYKNTAKKRVVLSDNTKIEVGEGFNLTKESLIDILKLKAYTGAVTDANADGTTQDEEANAVEIKADSIQISGLDTVKTDTKGSYSVKIKVIDGADVTEVTLGIDVVSASSTSDNRYDKVSAQPEIKFGNSDVKFKETNPSGKDIYTYDINKNSTFKLDDLKATAKDALGGDLQVSYEDKTIDTDKVTTTPIELKVSATDKVGRKTEVIVQINVVKGQTDNDYVVYTKQTKVTAVNKDSQSALKADIEEALLENIKEVLNDKDVKVDPVSVEAKNVDYTKYNENQTIKMEATLADGGKATKEVTLEITQVTPGSLTITGEKFADNKVTLEKGTEVTGDNVAAAITVKSGDVTITKGTEFINKDNDKYTITINEAKTKATITYKYVVGGYSKEYTKTIDVAVAVE